MIIIIIIIKIIIIIIISIISIIIVLVQNNYHVTKKWPDFLRTILPTLTG